MFRYFEAGELIEALEDEDTADVVSRRGGMEWTRMWDGSKQSYYYYNIATNESRFDEPAEYDASLDEGVENLPKRLKTVLALQVIIRKVVQKWNIARTFREAAATKIQTIARVISARNLFKRLSARNLLEGVDLSEAPDAADEK